MKPKSDWESQIRGSVRTAALNGGNVKVIRETEENLVRYLCEQFHQARQEGIGKILPTLYRIQASIPLTQGVSARKQIKELIEKLELKKKNEGQKRQSNSWPKGSIHKPVWLTSHQAHQLYEFCEDFSAEYNKYTGGNSTAILIALQRVIEDEKLV